MHGPDLQYDPATPLRYGGKRWQRLCSGLWRYRVALLWLGSNICNALVSGMTSESDRIMGGSRCKAYLGQW